jgi:hypothetical protein
LSPKTAGSITATLADFLEKYPLYRRLKLNLKDSTMLFYKSLPNINLWCDECDGRRTFVRISQGDPAAVKALSAGVSPDVVLGGQVVRLFYKCGDCGMRTLQLFLSFSKGGVSVQKVGQIPAPDISGDPGLSDRLGEFTQLYKKGLICESQGYGVGAYSYYRAMLEEIIEGLIQEIEDLCAPEEKVRFQEVISHLKEKGTGAQKIALVKDHLPSSLRPSGHNPLATLYGLLSEGLHQGNDEACLERAAPIRATLESFVHILNSQKQAAKALADGTRKVLEIQAMKNKS